MLMNLFSACLIVKDYINDLLLDEGLPRHPLCRLSALCGILLWFGDLLCSSDRTAWETVWKHTSEVSLFRVVNFILIELGCTEVIVQLKRIQ